MCCPFVTLQLPLICQILQNCPRKLGKGKTRICRATARRPPFPVNYVSWFPSELGGKAVPSTESPYSSQLSERDNRTPPSCHVAKSRPIRSFPAIKPGMASANQRLSTIEPGTLQHHNTKSYQKRCTCTSGSVLKFHS